MYSSGIGRQPISVMHRLGLSVSWQTLAGSGKKNATLPDEETRANTNEPRTGEAQDPNPEDHSHMGTLARLSMSRRLLARQTAAERELLLIYDNINMMSKVGEQVIGRTGEPVMLACLDKYVQLMKHEQNKGLMFLLEKLIFCIWIKSRFIYLC